MILFKPDIGHIGDAFAQYFHCRIDRTVPGCSTGHLLTVHDKRNRSGRDHIAAGDCGELPHLDDRFALDRKHGIGNSHQVGIRHPLSRRRPAV